MPALTGFSHSWKKIPRVEKSLGRQYISKKILCGCRMSTHIFRAFPRSRLDLGKVHLWGTWLCSTCPEVLSKWWGRAGLAFAENKSCLQVARHCVHRGSSTAGTPSLEGHLLWCFGGNLTPIQKVSLQLCGVMLLWYPGIIHAGASFFSSRLGPAHRPASVTGNVASQMWACGARHGEVSGSVRSPCLL